MKEIWRLMTINYPEIKTEEWTNFLIFIVWKNNNIFVGFYIFKDKTNLWTQ